MSTPISSQIGLLTLADPEDAIVDIVFIHGLTGNRKATWTKYNVFWPESYLPSDIPTARILSWGYDADIFDFWNKRAKDQTLNGHARQLCSDLAGIRVKTPTRPILFVLHSLGGIVFENALVLATLSAEQHIKKIASCVRGAIFLGSPLSGSGKAKWVEIGQFFAKLVGKDRNKDVVEALHESSPRLQELSENFANIIRDRSKTKEVIDVVFFYEEHATENVGQIVTKASATITGYEAQAIPADHIEMTKFASREDLGYIRIKRVLERWVAILGKGETIPPSTGVNVNMHVGTVSGGLVSAYLNGNPVLNTTNNFGHGYPQ